MSLKARGSKDWVSIRQRLTLGQAWRMLENAVTGADNPMIKKILDAVAPDKEALKLFTTDLDRIRSCRNGAAHTEAVADRSTPAELRDLLIRDGFLKRLVEIEKKMKEQWPDPGPR